MRQKASGSRRWQKPAAVAISLNAAFCGSVSGEHAPSPGGAKKPLSLAGRTSPFHGSATGSVAHTSQFPIARGLDIESVTTSPTEAQALNRIQAHAGMPGITHCL